jgi:heme/copper-type cytochrome/quinol oxidase subunit 2
VLQCRARPAVPGCGEPDLQGRPSVKVEFHADMPGTFVFYCNLTNDEGCRKMRGTLVVH